MRVTVKENGIIIKVTRVEGGIPEIGIMIPIMISKHQQDDEIHTMEMRDTSDQDHDIHCVRF